MNAPKCYVIHTLPVLFLCRLPYLLGLPRLNPPTCSLRFVRRVYEMLLTCLLYKLFPRPNCRAVKTGLTDMQALLLLCLGVEHIYETMTEVQIQDGNREVQINMKRAVNNSKTILLYV